MAPLDRIVIAQDRYQLAQQPRRDEIERLANDLRGLAASVDTDYAQADIDPSRRRVTWGEILNIYLGVKLVDVTYSFIIEKQLEKITEVIREWTRKIFEEKGRGKPNPRPQIVNILDKDGKTIATFKINKEGESYQESEEYKGRHRKEN